MKEIKTLRVNDKIIILNGVDPIKYFDLRKNKLVKYKKANIAHKIISKVKELVK